MTVAAVVHVLVQTKRRIATSMRTGVSVVVIHASQMHDF